MDYFQIDATKTTPLYLQMAYSVKNAIEQGVLRHDDPLPTEKELCSAFSCSRIVAKMAYDWLIKEHCVYRVKGKGTFVFHQWKHTVRIERILQIDTLGHLNGQSIERTTVFTSESPEYARIAALLGVDESATILYYLRVFRFAKQPLLLQACYVPASFVIKDTHPLQNEQSFFAWLEVALGQSIGSVRNRVGVVALEPWEAAMLHVAPGLGSHVCRSVVLSQSDKPFAYVEMRLPGTSFQIEVTHRE
jgi:GntR family transcriptional regulator